MSFYSKELYNDVGFYWRGYGFLYLLVLIAFVTAVRLAVVQVDLAGYIGAHGGSIAAQIPVISIKDGKATVDGPQPVYINDPDTGEVVMVIDTTGAADWHDKTTARVLLDAANLHIKNGTRETRVFSLADAQDMTLDKQAVRDLLDFFKTWFGFVAFPLLTFFSYVMAGFVMLAYGLAGIMFSRAWRAEAQFPMSVRLAVVAFTPATLIDAALFATQIYVPYWGLLKYIMALVYLNLAIKWCFEDMPKEKTGGKDVLAG